MIGVFGAPTYPAGTDAPLGIALWHVGDPGNVGTIVRTADALGPAFLALSAGCADLTGPKALRLRWAPLFACRWRASTKRRGPGLGSCRAAAARSRS